MTLVIDVVRIDLLHLFEEQDGVLNRCDNTLSLDNACPSDGLLLELVLASAKEKEHVEVDADVAQDVPADVQELHYPQKDEGSVAEADDHNEHDLSLVGQLELAGLVSCLVYLARRDEEDAAVDGDDLCGNGHVFDVVELTLLERAIVVVCLQEDTKHDQKNKSLNNDTSVSQKDCDHDTQNLAIHDNDLPVVVVSLISIVEEAELLPDLCSAHAVGALAHHREHSGWYAQAPDYNTRYGHVVGQYLILWVRVTPDLVVGDQTLSAVYVSAIEHIKHLLGHSRVDQEKKKNQSGDEFRLQLVHRPLDPADDPPNDE